MLYGNLKNLGDSKSYPKAIYEALEYLKENDFKNMSPDRYNIEGKDFFLLVQTSKTDFRENIKPESHKEYIDIQLSISGGEVIGFANDNGNNPIAEDLLEEKDIVFYNTVENEKFIKMEENDFLVLYPWDIHRPCCTDNEPSDIIKVVVKIKIDNL